MTGRAILLVLWLASPGHALDLALPGGTRTAQSQSAADSVRLPREPWRPGSIAPEVEGAIRRTAYMIGNPNLTTLQLLNPAREALLEQGYREVFTCADTACGGFDFRFQLDLLPPPGMHVDLGNFRYLLMTDPEAEPHTVALLASVSATAGFLHVTEVSTADMPVPGQTPEPAASVAEPPEESPQAPLVEALQSRGHAVLDGLEFATGSARLGEGPNPALEALAEWLNANPAARIVLVGHTDSVGTLEANAQLAQLRASAVRERLTVSHGVDPGQLQAAGAGALAPIASNLTEEGRAANRRVEAVLLSLD